MCEMAGKKATGHRTAQHNRIWIKYYNATPTGIRVPLMKSSPAIFEPMPDDLSMDDFELTGSGYRIRDDCKRGTEPLAGDKSPIPTPPSMTRDTSHFVPQEDVSMYDASDPGAE